MDSITLSLKHISILWSLILAYAGTSAQVTITGTVSSRTGSPLQGVSVLLYPRDTSRILVFDVTKTSGRYSVKHNTSDTVFLVKFSSIGYQTKFTLVQTFLNVDSVKLDVSLETSSQFLDTVRINAESRVRQVGDTIIFNPEAFSLKNENTVEQLLSRLPGLTIDETGKINFNGQPVTSVLLNGDDLFKGNYQEITRNASPEIIERVEVIKNYQKDRNLKQQAVTQGQVINLKIKKAYSNYIFGSISAGGGLNKSSVADVFLVNLRGATKAQVRVSGNNIGVLSSGKGMGLSPQNVEVNPNYFSYEPIRHQIEIDRYYSLNVPSIYQNINRTREASANLLFKRKDSLEVLLNLNYSTDSLMQLQSGLTTYPGGVQILRNNVRRERSISQSYALELSKIKSVYSLYIAGDLRTRSDNFSLSTQQNNLGLALQDLGTNAVAGKLNINLNRALTKTDLISFTYNYSNQNVKQDYSISDDVLFWKNMPTSNRYLLMPFYSGVSSQHNVQIKYAKIKKLISHTLLGHYKNMAKSFDSELNVSNVSPDSLRSIFLNNNRVSINQLTLLYNINLESSANTAYYFSAENNIRKTDLFLATRAIYNNYLPNYTLGFKLKIKKLGSLDASLIYKMTIDENLDYSLNPVISNYRTLSTFYSAPNLRKERTLRVTHSYIDLRKSQWISFISANLTFSTENFVRAIEASENRIVYRFVPLQVQPKILSVFFNSQKLVNRISTNFSTNVFFTRRDVIFLNDGLIFTANANSLIGSLSAKSAFKGFFNLEGSVSGNFSQLITRQPLKSTRTNLFLSRKLALHLTPSRRFFTTIAMNRISETISVQSASTFLDVNATLKAFKEKLELSLVGNNILGQNAILTNTITPFYSQQNSIQLRDKVLLLRVRYKIM